MHIGLYQQKNKIKRIQNNSASLSAVLNSDKLLCFRYYKIKLKFTKQLSLSYTQNLIKSLKFIVGLLSILQKKKRKKKKKKKKEERRNERGSW